MFRKSEGFNPVFDKEKRTGLSRRDKDRGPRFCADGVGASREATVLYIISCYKSHRMSHGGEMKIEIPGTHCSVKIYLLDILRARDSDDARILR